MAFLRRWRSHRCSEPQIQTQLLQSQATNQPSASYHCNMLQVHISTSPTIIISPPSQPPTCQLDDPSICEAPSPTSSVATSNIACSIFAGDDESYASSSAGLTPSTTLGSLDMSTMSRRRAVAWERAAYRIRQNKDTRSSCEVVRSCLPCQAATAANSVHSWLLMGDSRDSRALEYDAWLREI
jgi:hypothetical protein